MPYLDANRPTAAKDWEGIDAAVSGLWEVSAAMEPSDSSAEEVLARIFETTFNKDRIPFSHTCSHVSLRFRSSGVGEAILSSAVLHYAGNEEEA